jgi:two-component system, NarL family, response regulator DegU
MNKPIRISVVDDQQLFRKGLISLLREYDHLELVHEASNGREFLEKLEEDKPDLVLLDLEMPEMDGIKTTEVLQKEHPDLKILIVTMHNDEAIILHLIEKGAHGFLLKDDPIEAIVDAINGTMETGYYFNDRVSQAMLKGIVKKNMIKPKFGETSLSEREIEVAKLICQEMTNKEIADRLFLSARTVDGHRERILQKTGAKNTAGIVIYAMRNGLVD